MDHGNDSYAAWQTLYATTEQLDQIEVELLRQLTEYGKCLLLDLVAYFLIALYLFHTADIMSMCKVEISSTSVRKQKHQLKY